MPARARLILFLIALLPAPHPVFAQAAPQPEAAAGGFASYRLANGFRVILAPYPNAATARVELLVKVGSKQEGYGETGMAHLLEHMLFKGAGARADLKRELTALGATWNGTTSTDRTNYFATVSADPERVDALIRLEADRFLRPAFTADDLASEMSVVRNELERADNDAGSLLARSLQRQRFFWHGYGRPTLGARSDIENAPFAALRAFHRRHYRPDNAALIVSGKIDPARVLALAAAQFGTAANPPEPRPRTWTREDAGTIPGRAEIHRESGVTGALLSWLLPAASGRQTLALGLAMPALCSTSWGLLHKTLVEERKLALDVSCGVQPGGEYAQMAASASADKEGDAAALAQEVRAVVQQFARQGLSEEQLARVRRNRLQQFDRALASHEATAARLSAAEVAGDWRLLFHERDEIAALTLDEINAALRHWLLDVVPAQALLHHAPPPRAPQPAAFDAATLVAGKTWPATTPAVDPLPATTEELAAAVVSVPLADPSAQALLISRRTQNGKATLVIANDYGNIDSLSGRLSACSLADSLLAEGGGGLDRDALTRELEALEASARFGLGRIVLQAPPEHLARALEHVVAVRLNPALPAAAFERLKAAASVNIEAALAHPGQIAGSLAEQRFDNYPPDHPLRPRALAERRAEIEAIGIDEVRRCVTDFSGRSRLRIAAVGDLDAADVAGFWNILQRLPPTSTPWQRIERPAAPMPADVSDIVIARPQRPNADILAVTYLPIRSDADDFPALGLAVRLLGGDAASRFRLLLREREGLAYAVSASLAGNTFDERSSFTISASVASDKAEHARDLLRAELAQALAEGFTDAEVSAGIRTWLEQRRKRVASEGAYADRLVSSLRTGHGYAWDSAVDARIGQLTTTEVNAALRRHLGKAGIVWAIGKGE